jgi:MFS family permease
MLFLQYEPPKSVSKESSSLLSDIKAGRQFLFYSVSAALMQGTVAISGPFFNVWYVRDLKFDYFNLSIASAATIFGTIISLPFWGKLSDNLGNRKVILWSGFLVATVPVPYLFSSYNWQIWILNFYSGLCWSGYNLSNFNYLLTLSGKDKPERKISISAAITGLSVFFFSLLGGYLSTRLPKLFGWELKSLFLLSSVLRFAVYGLLFVRFPVHQTEKKNSLENFHQIPGYRVGMGILRNAFRAFRRI